MTLRMKKIISTIDIPEINCHCAEDLLIPA